MNKPSRNSWLLSPQVRQARRRYVLMVLPAAILAAVVLGGASNPARAVACDPGYYWDIAVDNCMPAPAGHYTDNLDGFFPCDLGTYADGEAHVACHPADPGHYVHTTASPAQYECAIGTYQHLAGQSYCLLAAPGTYAYSTGMIGQIACPMGKYQDEVGQASCKLAPAGHYVDEIMSEEPTECSPGSYQDEEEQEECKLAPINTYVDTSGATEPTDCPPGTFNPTEGADSASACNAPPTATFMPTSTVTQEADATPTKTPTPVPDEQLPDGDTQETADDFPLGFPLGYLTCGGVVIALGVGGGLWFARRRSD